MWTLPLLVVTALGAAVLPPGLSQMPDHMVLSAPYTPTNSTGEGLNASAANIDRLAAQAAAFGVTTVWVPGSMGQFDALTIDERKALVEAWAPAAKKHGLYLIAHVGTGSIGEAQELAKHAQRCGAPAIATVPPYYEYTTDVATIARFLALVGAAAPSLPLFYYHIPSYTRASIKVAELFEVAAAPANGTAGTAALVPTLAGVKFVSSDQSDWFELVQHWNSSRALLYAPEPKLASFSLGTGRGTVLAEDFFAPTYLRMLAHYRQGNAVGAAREQSFKLAAMGIIGAFGGAAAERALYRDFPLTRGFDFGPPRLPKAPFDESRYATLHARLEEIGFWEQLVPPASLE